MNYKELIIEKKGHISIITLNAPQNRNALGIVISTELHKTLDEIEKDPEVRVVVLKGAGKGFSSGGNLKEMRDNLDNDPEIYMGNLLNAIYTVIPKIQKISKPIIASVHGFAMGAGMNLALACDIVVATDNTIFSESFVKVGLIAAGHSTLILPKLIGLKKAAELCLIGDSISANEALELGLINKVVPEAELEAATMEYAKKLAVGPPLAVQATKKMLYNYFNQSEEEQAEEERQTQIKMAKTNDYREGVMSFFEKRKPEFKGK
ncbi:MAG: enoyl-CoA hydratase/isomerase family protein [Candidatus Hodarchaeota archaeon]